MITHKSQERSEASLAFEAYWRSLARPKTLPDFADFDLLGIPELVPNLITCEVSLAPVPDMTVRFSGSATQERSGLNLTGLRPADLFDEVALEAVRLSIATMIQTPCGGIQHNDVLYENAQNAVTEMILLPVATQKPDTYFLVGLVEWIGFHAEGSNEHPMRILPSTNYHWIDLGHGTPDW